MTTQYREQPPELLAAARTMLAQGDLAEARRLIDDYITANPKAYRGFLVRAEVAEQQKELGEAVASMERVVALRKGRSARHVLELARLLLADGRPAEAVEVLDAALARLGELPRLLRRAIRCAAATGDMHRALAYGQRYLAVFSRDENATPKVLMALSRMQRDCLREESAPEAVEQGLQRWPSSLGLLQAKAQICASIGRKATARAILRDHVLVHPELGEDDRAVAQGRLAFLEGKAYAGPDGAMVPVPFRAEPDALMALLHGDSAQGLFVRRSPGAHKMLLVFTGLAGEAGGMPVTVLDAMLRELPMHVVYLRDFQRLLYLKGVAELGANYEETVVGLRALQQELGATELYCMGSSAGGYGALQYAAALQADTVLAFAPPTTTDLDMVRRFDARGTTIGHRLRTEVPHLLRNLRDELQQEGRRACCCTTAPTCRRTAPMRRTSTAFRTRTSSPCRASPGTTSPRS
ncbi:tetratricopeptide repeat protein [Ramlibacter terrae]|uniref:Tetratricopeptide repeat protein n=1 Tax=Ramlibacter terrae TaxID=2732511 RepID=A0ABX6P373_9BURK|nr:tetratricopeptide repeat protein [Ramlibacter terrae]